MTFGMSQTGKRYARNVMQPKVIGIKNNKRQTMSSKKSIVVITPPEYLQKKEKFELCGFVCPNCNGRKEFIDQQGRDEFKSTKCLFCNGLGRVKAVVNVEWESDE